MGGYGEPLVAPLSGVGRKCWLETDTIMKKRVFNSSILKNGILMTGLFGLLGGLAGCGGSQAPQSVAEKPEVVTGVPTGELVAESVDDHFEAVGVVRSRNTTVISSKVVGTITGMRVREGDRVRAGQVLVEVENRDARAQLEKAEAGLREARSSTEELDRNLKAAVAARTAAEAQRRLAEATLKRYEGLRERKSVSAQEFEEVEARAQVAAAEVDRAEKMRQVIEARRQMVEARIDQAKADVAAAQAYVGYARITAPADGVVTMKQAEVGGLAAPGAPLLTLESGGAFRLEAAVEESRIGLVAQGAEARVRVDAIGGMELPGRVVEIVPAADPGSRTFTVRIELPVNSGLRSGQYGKAFLSAGSAGKREILLAPAAAVVRRGQLTGIYVVDGKGIARLRLVTLGRQIARQKSGEMAGDRYEILSGLRAGETIVTDGTRIEREGVQVK